VLRQRSFIPLIALSFLFFFGLSRNVYAYVDPGAGSYVVQFLIAGLLGLLYAVRIYWAKLKEFFITKILRQSKPTT
jgi:hypothetical protein